MDANAAIKPGNVAVITGAADGIGYAAATYFKSKGLNICLVDINADKLAEAAGSLGVDMYRVVDVADIEQVQGLKRDVYEMFGQVDILMNNAGTGAPNDCWTEYDTWRKTLDVNLWGVINGVHVFAEAMLAQATPGLIINTGSKQGITLPPGNPAYNVSKAGVKAFTESLQHGLRSKDGCQISAHLLVPGFTYTGMVKKFIADKPPGAWLPEQVVEFMVESIGNGDFYILCPDNDVDRETDNKRMEWAMGDIIHNRPPLSRWHSEFQQSYEEFMKSD